MIAVVKGLICGVILTGSLNICQADDLETVKVPLQYLNSTQAASLLNPVKSDSGTILIEEGTNSLILMDTIDHIQLMQKRLQTLDVPPKDPVDLLELQEISRHINEAITTSAGKFNFKNSYGRALPDTDADYMQGIWDILEDRIAQVTFEVKMIQIALGPEHQGGVNWSSIVSDARVLNFSKDVTHQDPVIPFTVGTISPEDYTVLLSALDGVGKTQTVTSSQVTVMNNHEAKILLGKRDDANPQDSLPDFSGANDEQSSWQRMELWITPQVDSNHSMTLTLNPLLKRETRSRTNNNQTTLTVKDGMTVIIGGLMKIDEIKQANDHPVLSRLPIVGSAFKNENNIAMRTELAIFLTPRISNLQPKMTKKATDNQ